MTNALGKENKPLSACSVPPVDLRGDFSLVKKIVDAYHQEAMGTGFDLSFVDDPVSTLLFLNSVAVSGVESGKEDRPVGNMATCKVDHPKIVEFITSKLDRPEVDWKFNISVDTPILFWESLLREGNWRLRDGNVIKSRELFNLMVKSAHFCADPGIIILDRLNEDNPTPGVGLYTSTDPCAEVGLVPGETCQFGYINLAKFVDKTSKTVDYNSLGETARLMTRLLDNALELSLGRYSVDESTRVMSLKRKIGVGVCGLADMLLHLDLPYGSDKAREICRDVISFINYQTKLESVELGKVRGSFGAMSLETGCRYNDTPGFLEAKYGKLDSNVVSANDWHVLGKHIRETGNIRNCSTIALPPTGRSGLVISASTGVEPLFTLLVDGKIHNALEIKLKEIGALTDKNVDIILSSGSCSALNIPTEIKEVFRTATEIETIDHLKMVAAIQPFVDESISKTINLPSSATVNDVEHIYELAFKSGLKGMTIYRDGSSRLQPKKVVNIA